MKDFFVLKSDNLAAFLLVSVIVYLLSIVGGVITESNSADKKTKIILKNQTEEIMLNGTKNEIHLQFYTYKDSKSVYVKEIY